MNFPNPFAQFIEQYRSPSPRSPAPQFTPIYPKLPQLQDAETPQFFPNDSAETERYSGRVNG
ncbi:MAG: hypothetical protein SNJ57_15380 [Cyanobacteriota bacterium]